MHKKFTLLLLAIVLLLAQFSIKAEVIEKGNNSLVCQTGQDDVSAIRAEYQKINSSDLKKQHFTYESSGCAEDGVVDYFFNNGQIVKIIESGAIGDGSWVNEYYYYEGKVIFCYEAIVGGPAIGKVTKTEYRMYVKDDKSVKTMEDKAVMKQDTKSAKAIQTANKIYRAYKTKNFAGALCN